MRRVETRFGILGPLEVTRAGESVRVSRSKPRAVLAILLLRPGKPVAADRIAFELWGDHAPETVRTALQIHVSRLRRALGDADAHLIRTLGHAYAIDVEPAQLDSLRFEQILQSGRDDLSRGEFERASARFAEALALWRGSALEDVEFESAAQEASHLDELRIEATSHLFEAELALGHSSELVAGLELAVSQWPFRERLRAQLMRALYRSGRQADALAAYRDAHRTLERALGIEPGEELRRLERAILVHDPSLDVRAPPPAALREARAVIDVVSRATSYLPESNAARAALLPELAELLMDMGEWDAARQLLLEAAAASTPAVAAHARLVRVRLELRAGSAGPAELERTADEAIRVLERVGDPGMLAEAWVMRAAVLWRSCRADETECAATRALDLAREAGDLRAEERALYLLLGAAVLGPLPVRRGKHRAAELRSDPRARVRSGSLRALAALRAMQGRYDEARDLAVQERRLLADGGDPMLAAGASGVHGMIELYAGDPAAAEHELRAGYEALSGTGEHSMLSVLAAQLARATEEQGRYEEALAYTRESEADAPPGFVPAHAPWRGVRARLLARGGESAEAERLAREGVALADATDFLNHQGDALSDLGATLRLLGRDDESARAFAAAEHVYRRKGNVSSARRARREARAGAVGPA